MLTKIQLLDVIKQMGAIIRELNAEGNYSEYWLNDGDYVPILEELEKDN